MSASLPGINEPFRSATPKIEAGVLMIILTTSIKGTSAMVTIVRTRRSAVATLPANELLSGNNSFTTDGVSKLSKGVYQLSIKWMNSGRTITKQFSKQ